MRWFISRFLAYQVIIAFFVQFWQMGIRFQQPIGITSVQMWQGDWPQFDLSVWSVDSGQFSLVVLRHRSTHSDSMLPKWLTRLRFKVVSKGIFIHLRQLELLNLGTLCYATYNTLQYLHLRKDMYDHFIPNLRYGNTHLKMTSIYLLIIRIGASYSRQPCHK